MTIMYLVWIILLNVIKQAIRNHAHEDFNLIKQHYVCLLIWHLEKILNFSLEQGSQLTIFFEAWDGTTGDEWGGVRYYFNPLQTVGKGWQKDQRPGYLAVRQKRVELFYHVPLVIFYWDIWVQNKKFKAN